MLPGTPDYSVTEYDAYVYDYIGQDTPELRAQAAAAKEEAIRYAKELRRKYNLPDLPDEV